MPHLLVRSGVNFLKRHPLQWLLAVAGITLGVAVVVAIDLAKSSALTAFDEAVRSVAGRATHRITGGPAGLEENLYRELALQDGSLSMAPKVEGYVQVQGEVPMTLKLVGMDLFSELPFQPPWSAFGAGGEMPKLSPLLTKPATVLMGADAAERLGIKGGGTLDLQVGTERKSVRVLDILSPADAITRQSVAELLLADIATAQEVLRMTGRLSRIDLILTDAQAAQLQPLLPPAARLLEYGAGDPTIRQMTRAFYTNISALSLLALLVGMFLIYNTMTFMVVQRRELFGTLRALGVTRGEIFVLVVGESAALGLAGTLSGLGVGMAMSHALLELVAKTISEVFSHGPPSSVLIAPAYLAKGAALGLGATLISALVPALQATAIPPVHAMRRSLLESRMRRRAWLGMALAAATAGSAVAALLVSGTSVLLGFAGLLLTVLAFALAAPAFSVVLMALLTPVSGACFGVLGRLAPRTVAASLSRTGVAIAALMVAVATTIGMQAMVGSFRGSVHEWLQDRVNADLYVSLPAQPSTASDRQLTQTLADAIADLEGVAHVGTVRRIALEAPAGLTQIFAYGLAPPAYAGFTFTDKLEGDIWRRFEEEQAVLVSEPYAFHHELSAGSWVPLPTDHGMRDFHVAAVFTDFNAGPGVVAMSRTTYDRFWRDTHLSGIWVYAVQGGDPEDLRRAIGALAGDRGVVITSNRAILETSLAIFDRAFTIPEVLRWLAAAVAFVGIFSALMALQLEREKEFAVLRAGGLTPGQLWLLILGETGLLGLSAGLLALPTGAVMAWQLIFVINRRTFGWSMTPHLAPEILLQGLGLALLAALLAGLYPAYKIAGTSPAEALRNE